MAKFLSNNLRVNNNQEVEFGSTGQRHLVYDTTHLRVLGGTFTIGAAGAGVDVILDQDNLGDDDNQALATQQSIKAYVDNRINGLDWQESVLDILDITAAAPGGAVTGDRYLLDDTGPAHGDWVPSGALEWDIVEYNGATWDVVYEAAADEGGATWVEDVNNQYVHNGTAWVLLSSIVGGITAGTVAGRTLRWSGAAWVESAALVNDDTDVTMTGDLLVSGGDITAGVLNTTLGSLVLYGDTSGTMTITTATAASGTWTFPQTGTAGAMYTNAGGTISTGDLPIADGGTAASAKQGAFDNLAPTSGAGEIVYHNGANNIALAQGNNTDVLTLAGGVPTWASPGVPGAHADEHEDGGADELELEKIASTGSADQVLQPSGGATAWSDNLTLAGELRMQETAGTDHYVGFVADGDIAGNTTYTLPVAFPGTSGFHLASTDAGILSWADAGDVIPDSTVVGAILVGTGPGDWAEDVSIRGAAAALSLGVASTSDGSIVFYNDTNANTVTVQSGVTSGAYALTLPLAVAGTTGDVLASTDAGVLSWITPYSDLLTTRGDLLYSATAGNVTSRLPIGVTGQYVKTSDGIDVSWGAVLGADVDIADAGGYFTGTTVEVALQEIGADTSTADGATRKHGRFSIANTTTVVVVDFTTELLSDFGSANYTLTYSLTNIGGGSSYGMLTTAKATTGFSVTLSGATDDANYVLEWVAIESE